MYSKVVMTMIICLLSIVTARADIAVVVNVDSGVNKLSERQVVDLFMGRYVAFPNGATALPLDQPVDSKARAKFYELLTGKTVPQINAYWAKLIFSGRASPPRVAPDESKVLSMIRDNKHAIGYVDARDLDKTVKVVYTLSMVHGSD